MKESTGFIKFNYKSSFAFFSLLLLVNLIGNPLIQKLGASYKMSLFISNSLACSIGIPFLVLFLLKAYKSRSQAVKFVLVSTLFCVLVSYMMVFHF